MARSVYEELREDIVTGHYPSGEALVETSLAQHYRVSRTPVREALLQLLSDGLVERTGRGISVVARSPEEILEIYEVRILLEGAAARLAASRRTEFDLTLLSRAHEMMRALESGDSATKAGLNAAFHQQLWVASHNATLIVMLRRLYDHLQRYPETTLDFPGRWETVLQEHTELLGAIESGDEDAAEDIARRHMTAARTVRLEMFAHSA